MQLMCWVSGCPGGPKLQVMFECAHRVKELMIGIQWRDFDGMSPSSIIIPRVLATVSDTWNVLLHMQHAYTLQNVTESLLTSVTAN